MDRAFNPEAFTVSNNLTDGSVWGGGHTVETDPTRKGWRCRHAWFTSGGLNMQLIGRPGVRGCATVVRAAVEDDGHWVKVFDATPQEVMATKSDFDAWMKLIQDRELWDATISPTPGFGLRVLQMIAQATADVI